MCNKPPMHGAPVNLSMARSLKPSYYLHVLNARYQLLSPSPISLLYRFPLARCYLSIASDITMR